MTEVWTEQNTEGFSADDLDMLNSIQAELEEEFRGIDPGNISAILNNAWVDGIAHDDLLETARRRLEPVIVSAVDWR